MATTWGAHPASRRLLAVISVSSRRSGGELLVHGVHDPVDPAYVGGLPGTVGMAPSKSSSSPGLLR